MDRDLVEGKARCAACSTPPNAALQELDQPKPPAFFLYIDQGEELYVRAEERQRRRFSEVLAAGARRTAPARADEPARGFFRRAAEGRSRSQAVHRQIDVPPLREAGLREVVSRPARLLGARFETEHLAGDIARRAAEEFDQGRRRAAAPVLSPRRHVEEKVQRGDGVLRLPEQAIDLGRVLVERADASSPPSRLRG